MRLIEKVIVSDAHVYEIDSTFITFSVDSSVLFLPEFEIDSSAEFLSKIDTFDCIGWQFEYVIADHLDECSEIPMKSGSDVWGTSGGMNREADGRPRFCGPE